MKDVGKESARVHESARVQERMGDTNKRIGDKNENGSERTKRWNARMTDIEGRRKRKEGKGENRMDRQWERERNVMCRLFMMESH